MEMSGKQRERQHYRSADGRYGIVNRCERCGKRLGVGAYWSAPWTNSSGDDLVLCERCCKAAEAENERRRQAGEPHWEHIGEGRWVKR